MKCLCEMLTVLLRYYESFHRQKKVWYTGIMPGAGMRLFRCGSAGTLQHIFMEKGYLLTEYEKAEEYK